MAYTTWGEISRIASDAGAKYPELVAAQWALESAWGASVSGKNNVFGIKGKGTKVKTTEYENGKEVVVYDEFMDFANITECIQYLVERWYRDYQNRYMGVNRAKDRNAAARMLVTEGYATDPNYAEKLIKLMDSNATPVQQAAPVAQSRPVLAAVPKSTPPSTVETAPWEDESAADEPVAAPVAKPAFDLVQRHTHSFLRNDNRHRS